MMYLIEAAAEYFSARFKPIFHMSIAVENNQGRPQDRTHTVLYTVDKATKSSARQLESLQPRTPALRTFGLLTSPDEIGECEMIAGGLLR
jgi:hypothetical protein